MTPEDIRLAACGLICARCGRPEGHLYGHGPLHGRTRGVCAECIGLALYDAWSERVTSPLEEHAGHVRPRRWCSLCRVTA